MGVGGGGGRSKLSELKKWHLNEGLVVKNT